MKVTYLYLAVVLPLVFHCYGLATRCIGILIHRNDLPIVFCCQYCFMLGLYVDAFVHLLLGRIQRVLSHAERRSYQHELLTVDRETVFDIILCLSSPLSIMHSEFLSLTLHIFHDHAVVLVQTVHLDNFLKIGCITASCGITGLFKSFSPSLIVIRR